jgi:hypothetical protein
MASTGRKVETIARWKSKSFNFRQHSSVVRPFGVGVKYPKISRNFWMRNYIQKGAYVATISLRSVFHFQVILPCHLFQDGQ